VAGSSVAVELGCSLRKREEHWCAVGYCTPLKMMDCKHSSPVDNKHSVEMEFLASSVADCTYFLVTDYTC